MVNRKKSVNKRSRARSNRRIGGNRKKITNVEEFKKKFKKYQKEKYKSDPYLVKNEEEDLYEFLKIYESEEEKKKKEEERKKRDAELVKLLKNPLKKHNVEKKLKKILTTPDSNRYKYGNYKYGESKYGNYKYRDDELIKRYKRKFSKIEKDKGIGELEKMIHDYIKEWETISPKTLNERLDLARNCGSSCFLNPETGDYPICPKCGPTQCYCGPTCSGLYNANLQGQRKKNKRVIETSRKLGIEYGCDWALFIQAYLEYKKSFY